MIKKSLAYFLLFVSFAAIGPHCARGFDFTYDMPQFQYGIHYKWNLGQWVEDSRWTPFYKNGEIDSMFVEAYVNQTYVPYEHVSEYYMNGNVQHFDISVFDGTSWSGLQVDSFTYANNRILYQDEMVYKNGVLQTHNLFTHSYNNTGVRIERLEEDLVPGPRRNDDDWLYSYDSQGRIDTLYDNNWDGAQWVYKAREIFLYGAGGELDTVAREYYSNGSWARGEIFVINGAVVPGMPHLSVPQAVLFDTLAGATQTKSVTLTNTGTAPLTLPTLTLRNGAVFSLADTSGGSIAAGSSATISVIFAPTASGIFYDTLVIGPADAPLALVYLSGIGEMGRIEITKDTTLLSAVAGSSDTGQVKITNHGEVSVMITVARVLNSPNDFSVEGLVDPIQIAAGQSASLSVYYSPTVSSPAASSATVSMSYTDGGLHTDTIFVLEGTVAASDVSTDNGMAVSISLSPNPATNQITLDGLTGIKEVRILDVTGREVLSEKVSGAHESLNISTLANGVYTMLFVPTSAGLQIQRFAILH